MPKFESECSSIRILQSCPWKYGLSSFESRAVYYANYISGGIAIHGYPQRAGATGESRMYLTFTLD